MNFKIVVSQGDWNFDYSFLTSQEGRFGVLFIFLAGMGVVLMNKKALEKDDRELLKQNRIRLFKRSLFLLVTGLIFSLYWPADILHYYAFYLLSGLVLISLPAKILYMLSPLPLIIFLLLNFFFSWEKGWDFQTFSYLDFYTLRGFFRSLFFNGFHPVFPWFSFFIFGMAAGKSNLKPGRGLILKASAALSVVIIFEILSYILTPLSSEDMISLIVSTRAFPPSLFYVISAGAQAAFFLFAVILVSSLIPGNNFLIVSLMETGRFVMTHYITHLIVGLIPLYILHSFIDLTDFFVLSYSFVYFLFTIGITLLWRSRFKQGPMEGFMRKLT